MIIKTAEFIKSSTDNEMCPKDGFPEYAFIGRSNVGKSSLINMLTNNKRLAKTSGQPGKTQLINHFLINKDWHLVDLPGYGYAKVSKGKRKIWSKFIKDYVLRKEDLVCLFVLIDARHEPQKIDMEFMKMLGGNSVPFVIVFTKTDKITVQELSEKIDVYKTELMQYWEHLPEIFITSAITKLGRDDVLDFIESINTIEK